MPRKDSKLLLLKSLNFRYMRIYDLPKTSKSNQNDNFLKDFSLKHFLL